MQTIPVYFHEGSYCVRSLEHSEDLTQAYQLRHEVFRKRLQWLPATPWQLDIDEYDEGAHQLGVFDLDNTLCAVARLISPDHAYMMETAFSALVDEDHDIRKEADTAEVSRLTVSPFLKQAGVSPAQVAKILYKGIYHWSVINQVRYLYLVVEKKFWKALLLCGFPCKPVGEIKCLPPAKVQSVAAILDWNQFRHEGTLRHTQFLDWVSAGLPNPAQLPEQWHDPVSMSAISSKHFARETLPYAR